VEAFVMIDSSFDWNTHTEFITHKLS